MDYYISSPIDYRISDCGTHFKNSMVEEFNKLMLTKHHFTLPFCPWSNGSVERCNRDILAMLRCLLGENLDDLSNWPYYLPIVQSAN